MSFICKWHLVWYFASNTITFLKVCKYFLRPLCDLLGSFPPPFIFIQDSPPMNTDMLPVSVCIYAAVKKCCQSLKSCEVGHWQPFCRPLHLLWFCLHGKWYLLRGVTACSKICYQIPVNWATLMLWHAHTFLWSYKIYAALKMCLISGAVGMIRCCMEPPKTFLGLFLF